MLLFPPYPTRQPFRVHLNSLFPRLLRTSGLTVGRHVFIARPSADPLLVAHEYRHVEQFARWGILGFPARYLWHALRHGHATHPLELDAREYARTHRHKFPQIGVAR